MSEIKSGSHLPERASLQYLKRLAKEHLALLRQSDPRAKLAAAQLDVARQHGFASWRALKAEVDARRGPALAAFFAACSAGDAEALRRLLDSEPSLVHERNAEGALGLHLAAPHEAAVRLLLERGADVNARDIGDNASALHFAAQSGALGSVAALLDAGADVRGDGDVHRSGVIGWATLYGSEPRREVVRLLLERGARHHIFSAIAVGDGELIQRIAEENPDVLSRRLSRFEQGQTPLHYVVAAPDGIAGGGFRTGQHYQLLDLLIELGADVEARDDKGRTPLALAMLRGDEEAMRRLHAAGAKAPEGLGAADSDAQGAAVASSITRLDPMLGAFDMAATIRWYRTIGFQLAGTHEHDGVIDWASLSLGNSHIMLVPGGTPAQPRGVSLWLRTGRIDDLYQWLKRRQLERARQTLAGEPTTDVEVRFNEDIYDTHYGARIFSIVDPNGYTLIFIKD